MWEKIRIDGTKKLKCTAVPTIFGELVTQQKNKKAKINRKFNFNFVLFIILLVYIKNNKNDI